MSEPCQVGLLIETSNAYARGLMSGVAAYVRQHVPWAIFLSESHRGDCSLAWLSHWKGQGLIARIENPKIARFVKQLGIPVVDVSAARLIPSLPWVETDDEKIAQLATEHLLERGFKRFGFCGDHRFNWSRWRQEHFADLIRKRGLFCSIYNSGRAETGYQAGEIEGIAGWVSRLPKPAAIMACYDFQGRKVLNACSQRGIAVPDEVAVLGVDNDEVLCDFAAPPLSSVILNPHRTGYEAAALLARMMDGERIGAEAHRIEPLGVATRQSTDVLAVEDGGVAAAVRFIREHACEGISVKDVLRAVPQSRRSLEERFKKLIGRTPHEEISRVQLNQVKLLLAETDWSLERIAECTGFAHAGYLSSVFRRMSGATPSHYRALNRPKVAGKIL